MNNLEKSFDSFFSGEARVAVIKGEWGVGKTYFWEQYISHRIRKGDLSQIAYSYISLFGSSSLGDIRKSVFHNAKAISNDERLDESFEREFNESSSLFNKAPWIKAGLDKVQNKAPMINFFSKNSQNIPVISKFSGMISSLEYSLVKNYVVCIDDMERKGKALSVKEIMGLADELAQRKECKVVLIFNEHSFDNEDDKAQFESYREKVVDIEINHNPTSKENLACIFSNDFERYSVLEETVNKLDIKNIRVLRKLKWMFEKFKVVFEEKNEQITDEFIVHSTLLCWSYYIRDKDLTFGVLKEQISSNSWMSYLSDKDKDMPEGQKKYRTLASSMQLSSSLFDQHIIFFLENGYYEENKLAETIIEFNENVRVNSVNARLRNAWDIYSDSLEDNLDEFKVALKCILDNEIPRLGLSDFSSAIDILENFDENVSPYIDQYIEAHEETLKTIDTRFSWEAGRFKCQMLKNKIEGLQTESRNYNLDDISYSIAVNRSWSSEDIDFLSALSKEDYILWIKSKPDDLVTKVRSGLLKFRGMHSGGDDSEKYKKITNNIVAALQDIAMEHKLNEMRVKLIYGIDPVERCVTT